MVVARMNVRIMDKLSSTAEVLEVFHQPLEAIISGRTGCLGAAVAAEAVARTNTSESTNLDLVNMACLRCAVLDLFSGNQGGVTRALASEPPGSLGRLFVRCDC